MKSPITGKEMILKHEPRKLTFRKEEYEVIYQFYYCQESKEQFTDDKLDEINLTQLYNHYRKAHSLPFPEEIAAIRNKFGLPASKMSEILGFGINQYRNYENGEVPSESNARLIQMADDPLKFKDLVGKVYKGSELDKIMKHIDPIIEKENHNASFKMIHHYLLGDLSPDEFTGFKIPNLEKLSEMVVFFTEKLKPWKTKLNKLLFYADFLNYKLTAYSISGIRYRAIDRGPVPNNYDSLFDYIANNNLVEIERKEIDSKLAEKFLPIAKRKFNASVFTEQELDTMQLVAEKFSHTSATKISLISHKEKAWDKKYHDGKKLISYNEGFELSQITV